MTSKRWPAEQVLMALDQYYGPVDRRVRCTLRYDFVCNTHNQALSAHIGRVDAMRLVLCIVNVIVISNNLLRNSENYARNFCKALWLVPLMVGSIGSLASLDY